MDRKPLPDNHIRRVMDASLPGLEEDPWFEERVIRRIRTAGQTPARKPRKRSNGLLIALALVLMTATAVAVSLTHGNGYVQQIITATSPDGENDQPELPFSGAYTGAGEAMEGSLAACGHGHTTIHWRRRYMSLGPAEHQLVDTTYAMCESCGAVFWVHDSVIVKEEHEKTEVKGRWNGREYLTCTYCHAQWNIPDEGNP